MPFPAAVPNGGFLEVHDTAKQRLGCRDWDENQREWVYLKAGVAIEQGEALKSNMAVDTITDISTVAVADSTIIEDSSSTFVTNNVEAGMMISISDGAGEGQLGIIREVISETKLRVEWITSDDGKLDTDCDANSDAVIFAPWLATLSDVDVSVIGFAQKDVASGKYFWALVQGIGLGRMGATAIACPANTPLTADATAGQLSPTAATDLDSPCATAVHDQDADTTLFPIMAHATPISAVPFGDRLGYAPALT